MDLFGTPFLFNRFVVLTFFEFNMVNDRSLFGAR